MPKPAAAVSLDLRSDGALLFVSQATGREENIMLASAVAAAKNMIVRCARALWRTVKCVMEPARSATTAAAGVVRDSARSRSGLIAENAFLRQQLIVVSRSVSRLPQETIEQIQRMARDNLLWGGRADPRRTPQAGDPCQQADHSEVRETGTATWEAVADLGDLLREPRRRHLGVRLPAAVRRAVPAHLRVLHRQARDARSRALQRHSVPK